VGENNAMALHVSRAAKYYLDLYKSWMLFQRLLALGCIDESMERALRAMYWWALIHGIEVIR
jgi:hypothetical protein